MRVTFRPEAAKGVRGTYEYHIDDQVFHVRVANQTVTTASGPAANPDYVLKAGTDAWLALASRELTPKQALKTGAVELHGDEKAFERSVEIFGLPVPEEA